MVARSGVGGSAGSSADASDPREPATEPVIEPAAEPAPEPPLSEAAARWRRLVRALQRIRRLQRLWGLLGWFLQSFPPELRDRLRDSFPKEPPARRR